MLEEQVRWEGAGPPGPPDGTGAPDDLPGTSAVPRPPPGRGRRTRIVLAVLRHLGVMLAFAVPAVVLWWHAWDGHLASTLACSCGDPGQQVWFVAWPAYAITHGASPFFSHQVYAPAGANLLSSTSSPVIGLLVAPVTLAFGPVTATNVALTLAPALSAWGAWICCRHFTSWPAAPWVTGLLYGYSPFVVTNVAFGHAQLSLLVVPPLAMVVAHRLLVVRQGSPWWWGAALGLLVVLQFMISTEVLTMMAVVGGLGVVVWAVSSSGLWGCWRGRAGWRAAVGRLGYPLRGLAATVVVAGVVLAYPVWYALAGPRHISGSPWPGIQVAGIRLFDLWNPGAYGAPESAFARIGGYEGLAGPPATYLGWAVLALAAVAVVLAFRRRLTRALIVLVVLTLAMAVGIYLWTSPTGVADVPWLPWQTLGQLPLLDRVAPQRFMAFTDLFVALLVGVGLDTAYRLLAPLVVAAATPATRRADTGRSRRPDTGRTRRPDTGRSRRPDTGRSRRPDPGAARRRAVGAALAAVGILAVVPVWWTYQVPLRTERVSLPAWYATAGRRVPTGSVVLAYPFPLSATATSQAMVWQAVDGMRFDLAGGYLKAPGPGGHPLALRNEGLAYDTLAALSARADGSLPTGTPAQLGALRTALSRWHVRYVVVADRGIAPVYASELLTAVVGRPPALSHRAWVWQLRPGAVAPTSPQAMAAAVHACVPAPAYGAAPADKRLPLAGADCVAGALGPAGSAPSVTPGGAAPLPAAPAAPAATAGP